MAKKYNIRYTNLPLPGAKPPIQIDPGMLNCVAVRGASEGELRRATVKQLSGPMLDFTVEILESKVVYPPGQNPTTIAVGDDPANYRVINQQNGVAGTPLEITDSGGWANADGTSTNNQDIVYVVIIPKWAGGEVTSTTWSLHWRATRTIG